MKKTIAMLIAIAIVVCMSPTAYSATTVTGTFTPTSSGVSILCNNTSPAFSAINLGASGIITAFNVTNEGDTNCSVKMTAGEGAGTWSLVAGTSSPATTNEYCVNMDGPEAGYVDVQAEKTVITDLMPSGAGTNYTSFDLKVFVSDFTSEGEPEEQTFYANLTAAALT